MEKDVEKQGLIEGHPCLVAFVYESDNNVLSQRLVETLVTMISLSLGDQITTTLATSVLPVCSEENS